MRLLWYVTVFPPNGDKILIPLPVFYYPLHASLLRGPHNHSLIRISGGECATGNIAYQLLTIEALASLSTDLSMPHGVMMVTDMCLSPSPLTMNRNGFVGLPILGTVERKAKVTLPDPRVTLPERELPPPSHHHHHPPSTAAHYTITSEARKPLPNQRLTAEWYPKSCPSDTSLPNKVQATLPGDLSKRLLHSLTS